MGRFKNESEVLCIALLKFPLYLIDVEGLHLFPFMEAKDRSVNPYEF